MTAFAPTFERPRGSLSELAERVRGKVRGWLGHTAARTTVQAPVAPHTPAYAPAEQSIGMQQSYDYVQQLYGGRADYRADPYDTAIAAQRASVTSPYKVSGERGQRFETPTEKTARMAQFDLQYPGADVVERHNFSYSGFVPEDLKTRTNTQAYEAANPYNSSTAYSPRVQQMPIAGAHATAPVEIAYTPATPAVVPVSAGQPYGHLPHAA